MPAIDDFLAQVADQLQQLDAAGLMKRERVIASKQSATVRLADDRVLINLCANNYLGLSADSGVIAAAQAALASHGFGLSSVRFICGTQDIHKTLEIGRAHV